ncbi:hypothetical protein CHGG_04922 [Chaetomium globosum CBS 148.51]|uniref:Uncharacterized protein n=1 Tax=Chaetomium globosum (strain ATCC 6205 / CBS 148.51 / DSM 1962 / NBRC 6347 / NRRL 1970) TaxID=306901 RepID=Q2GZX4_CHAGB|nr:uncharacterized protein CHGG_04922 [Chaetomium globosum CBS 148.51]EAQ88303.1 hypothetical protein CHGG_04922 [Chaetomium globosum CBS 148.51]
MVWFRVKVGRATNPQTLESLPVRGAEVPPHLPWRGKTATTNTDPSLKRRLSSNHITNAASMLKQNGRSPSGHFSRLKPVDLDPLVPEYGLPSKGEKRLLSHKTQESYYSLIVSRYLSFCTAAGDGANLQKQFARLSLTSSSSTTTTSSSSQQPTTLSPLPPPTQRTQPQPIQTQQQPPTPQHQSSKRQPNLNPRPTPPTNKTQPSPSTTTTTAKPPPLPADETLPQILSALRKLREGLVASRRRDHFAAQVYIFSVRLGVLAGAYETYHPAGLYLLRWHTDAAGGAVGGGEGSVGAGVGGGGSLTSVELHEVVAYLVLDAACRRGDLAGAYELRNRHGLRDGKVDAVLGALVADNWVVWRRVKGQVDGYRAKLMEFAELRMTGHTHKAVWGEYWSGRQECWRSRRSVGGRR